MVENVALPSQCAAAFTVLKYWAWRKGSKMTKKIIAICILCCFFSSTLYAQTTSLEQRSVAVQMTGARILATLHLLVEQLDQGMTLDPGDMDAVLVELRKIDNDAYAISGALQSMSSDNSSTCTMIRLISLTWGAIGLLSVTSLLTAIVRLAILQSTSGVFPALHERKITRQYLKIASKLLVTSVILPISVINVLLVSRQYRECVRADL